MGKIVFWGGNVEPTTLSTFSQNAEVIPHRYLVLARVLTLTGSPFFESDTNFRSSQNSGFLRGKKYLTVEMGVTRPIRH